ncbi:hypothetical protein ASPFODRAFT_520431 [Aspergillus luchuensis CBS 106.47]|uniref:Uncharacterized protein n=1 Tax=Aspergillus luchuensis (strain CBS 106.47) TaxID=1137211 RepID=A0A1M3SZ67_ASPLC|nr:hypothetical protein ASPFODRAFT_520431 [Aspergillus luchuensis CBS 106.47]
MIKRLKTQWPDHVSQCSPPMASITRATGRRWSPIDGHPLTRERPHTTQDPKREHGTNWLPNVSAR